MNQIRKLNTLGFCMGLKSSWFQDFLNKKVKLRILIGLNLTRNSTNPKIKIKNSLNFNKSEILLNPSSIHFIYYFFQLNFSLCIFFLKKICFVIERKVLNFFKMENSVEMSQGNILAKNLEVKHLGEPMKPKHKRRSS